jgi:hypothetical protein
MLPNREMEMQRLLISRATLCGLVLGFALSLAVHSAEQPLRPCDQIIHICKQAGFVEGAYKKGYGLWLDCIDPIMRGTKQPAIADKRLPEVSSELIEACRQKDPKFGEHQKAQPRQP